MSSMILNNARRLFWFGFVGALQQLVNAQILFVDAQDLDQGRLGNLRVIKPVEQVVGVVISTAG